MSKKILRNEAFQSLLASFICIILGVPARVVRRNGKRVQDLDQVHIPDPISQELCKLRAEIDKLKKKMEEQEQ